MPVSNRTSTQRRRLSLIASAVGIAMGVVLPITVLTVLGWIWLWERGYAFYWVFVTLALTVIGLSISFLTLRRIETQSRGSTASEHVTVDHDNVTYSPREEMALAAVEAIARDVKPAELQSREAALALGIRTVEAVARHIHPETPDAIWRFTVPEALTLIERVAGRLKPLIAENIPLGDQLNVGQVLRIYRWRSAIDLAQKAYDIWRLARMMNPIAAATQEVRERMTRSIYAGVREELGQRIAAAYVREVGRAAIDLYGGRLRVDDAALAEHVSDATAADSSKLGLPAEPVRILVGGQVGAGKSSLINALAGEVAVPADVLSSNDGYVPVRVTREGLPEMILIEAPGPGTTGPEFDVLAERAATSDLIVWVAGANRADRQPDRAALDRIDAYFTRHTDRRPAPKLVVLSHIDQLRPAREWSPPYDLGDTSNAKAQSITDAISAVADDLGVEATAIVPSCLAAQPGHYNVDVVWAKIAALLPEAKRTQLLRLMVEARGDGISWRRVLSQAAGAGRLIAGGLKEEVLKR